MKNDSRNCAREPDAVIELPPLMDIERIEPEDVPILLRWQALAVIGQKVKALKDFEHGTDFGVRPLVSLLPEIPTKSN